MRHIFRVASLVGCILLAVSLVTTANAEPVDDFWTTVRSGDDGELGTEDDIALDSTIRVVFVTSAPFDVSRTVQVDGTDVPILSDNWQDYKSFGDGQAASGKITGGFGFSEAEWRPLVSTASRDNYPEDTIDDAPVKTWLDQGADIPVFNSRGEFIGADGSSMRSSGVNAPIQFDQSGDDQAGMDVWTGTESDGTEGTVQHPDDGVGQLYTTLGIDNSEASPGDFQFLATLGDSGSTGADWIEAALSAQNTTEKEFDSDQLPSDPTEGTTALLSRPIYVMSGEVTVVPEPSTVLLWLGCSGLAGLIYWRKRRRS